MSVQDDVEDMVLVARARSRVYGMLAAAFGYPTLELYTHVESGTYADRLTETVGALYADLEDQIAGLAVTLCAAASLADQEADYLRIFETDVPKPAVSLYEGMSAKPAERAATLLELKAFFRQFGLAMNESVGELEDSVMAELEFMQFLAAKEAEAIEIGRDRRPYQLAQRDFLGRHLGKWLPDLAHSAAGVSSSFYRSAAQIAAMFVGRDEIAVLRSLQDDAASSTSSSSLNATSRGLP